MNEVVRRGRSGKTTLLVLQEAETSKRLAETVCVLAQPHRRGDNSELRESVVGRFVMDNKCGIECYHGAHDYLCTVMKWRIAKGVWVPAWAREEFGGSGAEMDGKSQEAFERRVLDWGKTIRDCESAMKRSGLEAYRAADKLIIDDIEVTEALIPRVKTALHALAIQLGRFPY